MNDAPVHLVSENLLRNCEIANTERVEERTLTLSMDGVEGLANSEDGVGVRVSAFRQSAPVHHLRGEGVLQQLCR